MRKVDVALGEIAYCEEGEGQPWVLVHGFPLDHTMWRGQIEFLARFGRVLAVDLPGFGATAPVSEQPLEMAALADALAEWLDRLDVTEPVYYVGLSMGGYIGWEFYRRHASRVKGLVMCDTRAAADTDEARSAREETARRVLAEGPAFLAEGMVEKLFAEETRAAYPERVEETAAVMRGTARSTIAAALRGMARRDDMTGLLPEIGVPTLLVGGVHDLLTPPDEMASVAARILHAVWVPIDGAGHMAPLERPDAVNRVIREWVAGD